LGGEREGTGPKEKKLITGQRTMVRHPYRCQGGKKKKRGICCSWDKRGIPRSEKRGRGNPFVSSKTKMSQRWPKGGRRDTPSRYKCSRIRRGKGGRLTVKHRRGGNCIKCKMLKKGFASRGKKDKTEEREWAAAKYGGASLCNKSFRHHKGVAEAAQ